MLIYIDCGHNTQGASSKEAASKCGFCYKLRSVYFGAGLAVVGLWTLKSSRRMSMCSAYKLWRRIERRPRPPPATLLLHNKPQQGDVAGCNWIDPFFPAPINPPWRSPHQYPATHIHQKCRWLVSKGTEYFITICIW